MHLVCWKEEKHCRVPWYGLLNVADDLCKRGRFFHQFSMSRDLFLFVQHYPWLSFGPSVPFICKLFVLGCRWILACSRSYEVAVPHSKFDACKKEGLSLGGLDIGGHYFISLQQCPNFLVASLCCFFFFFKELACFFLLWLLLVEWWCIITRPVKLCSPVYLHGLQYSLGGPRPRVKLSRSEQLF